MSKLIHYSGPNGSILLPSGYTRLAWIEGTGSLWLQVGTVTSSANAIVHLEIQCTDNVPGTILCARSNASGVSLWTNGYSQWGTDSTPNSTIGSTMSTNRSHITMKQLHVIVNGKDVTIANGSSYYTGPLLLFNTDGRYGKFKFYKLSWSNGSTPQAELVPVKKSNGDIGVLDLLTNTFYKSLTSTQFIAGPECPLGFPTGLYCLVEWLEGVTLTSTVIPCYRRSDMRPGTYNLSTRAFTEAALGTPMGPSITFGWGEVVNGSGYQLPELLGTSDLSAWDNPSGSTTKQSNGYYKVNYTGSGWWGSRKLISLTKGKWYTLSGWCYGAGASVRVFNGGVSYEARGTAATGNTPIYSRLYFTPPSTGNYYIICYCGKDMNLYYKDVQLVEGNSVSAYPAIPHNMSSGEGRNGEKNGSFYFNGTNSELVFDSPQAQLTNAFTIACWFNPELLLNYRGLGMNHGGSNQGIVYGLGGSTTLSFSVGNKTTFKGVGIQVELNKWLHVAMQYKRGEYVKVYLNGILMNSITGTDIILDPITSSNYVGRAYPADNRFWKGRMQDFQVWNEIVDPATLM